MRSGPARSARERDANASSDAPADCTEVRGPLWDVFGLVSFS
jgi:hypothetical protein